MGNYYTTYLNDRIIPTMPYSWLINGYLPDNHVQTKSPVMSPKMQRLDSIGEDVHDTHFTSLAYGSREHKVQPEQAFHLKGSTSDLDFAHIPTFPKSVAVAVTSNACGLSFREGNQYRSSYCERLLKSHSLPEVGSSFSSSDVHFTNMVHSHLIPKPNRSWSVGSYGDKKTAAMSQEQPSSKKSLSLSSKARLFSTSPECVKLATCEEQKGTNQFNNSCPEIDSNGLHSKFESEVSAKEPESHDLKSSEKSSQVQYNEALELIFSTSKNNTSKTDQERVSDCETGTAHMEQSTKLTVQMSPVVASSSEICFRFEHEGADSNCDHDLSSILFSPRKAKKGRPSSKKQKKRKRQKQKHSSKTQLEQLDGCSGSLHESVNNTHQTDDVQSCEYELSSSVINCNNDSNHSLSPNVSTPIKSPSPHPIVHWFLSSTASSECEDSESEEEHSDSSFEENCSTENISSINSHGLGISHNLDSIFKQKHVPSLESLFSSDCSDDSFVASPRRGNSFDLSCSGSIIFSDGEDGNISIEFATSSPSLQFTAEKFLSAVPSTSSCQASCPTEDENSLLDNIEAEDAVDLDGINSKWDEMYSSPESCNCCNKNYAAEASGPFVKVQFLEGPGLSSVYIVADIGDEDRAGTWHHYALDRERFQRRIAEASQVLSPVLEESHRSAIAKRNAELLRTQSCGESNSVLES